jgi:DNA-binding transcriptional LysR family regulator
VAVAEEGQMTRAATRLHLAQPALSHAIKQLESHIGVELLERHARGTSLTAGGKVFLPRARAALAAVLDAELMAQSAAQDGKGTLEMGFIGPPPPMKALGLLAAFSETSPGVDVRFRELPFPNGSTASWLEHVDVALCHPPAADRGVEFQRASTERRLLVAPHGHRLAHKQEVTVADVLDESFLSYHPDVQSTWAGFHSLDDHRGTPPERMTAEGARTALEMLALVASGRGVTTLPECDAELIPKVLSGVAAIPIRDAHPFTLAMVWRSASGKPHVDQFVSIARRLAEDQASAAEARPRALARSAF